MYPDDSKILFKLACISVGLAVASVLSVGVSEIAARLNAAANNTENSTAVSKASSDPLNSLNRDGSHDADQSSLSDDAFNQQQVDRRSRGAGDRPVVKHQSVYLQLQSNPPGARAEIGTQFSGWKIAPGTGRKACMTPCVVKLTPTDVALLPNGNAHLMIKLEKANFASHVDVIELGKLERDAALMPGKTYQRSITLQHCDWLPKNLGKSLCHLRTN